MAKKIKKSENGAALVELVVNALLDKKAKDVVSLDLRNIKVSIADFFVIAHGESNTQVNALHQTLVEKCRENGFRPYHTEGMANGEWIIVDFVDVVVHIFHRDKRDFYQLEDLWHDASTVKYGEDAKPIEEKKVIKKAPKAKVSEEQFVDDAPLVKKTFNRRPVVKKSTAKAAAKKADPKAAAKKATPVKSAPKSAAKKAPAKKAVAKKTVAKKDVKKKS